MIASRLALWLTVLASPTVVFGNAGHFTYDIDDKEAGPLYWGNIPISDNECNGTGQSPIDITTSRCTLTQDYKFTVSSVNPGKALTKLLSEIYSLTSSCSAFKRTLSFQ